MRILISNKSGMKRKAFGISAEGSSDSQVQILITGGLQHRFRTSLLNLALLATISEVDDQPYAEPYKETYPGSRLQAVHHVSRNHDSSDRREWNPRCDEGALNFRAAGAQDPYSGTHDDEREQRADRYHFAKHIYWS